MMEAGGVDECVGLDEALEAVFSEERPCESVDHLTRPTHHAGAAQWYVHVKHVCGHEVVMALCDRIKQTLGSPLAVAVCSGCGVSTLASEVVRGCTRIGS